MTYFWEKKYIYIMYLIIYRYIIDITSQFRWRKSRLFHKGPYHTLRRKYTWCCTTKLGRISISSSSQSSSKGNFTPRGNGHFQNVVVWKLLILSYITDVYQWDCNKLNRGRGIIHVCLQGFAKKKKCKMKNEKFLVLSYKIFCTSSGTKKVTP